jgi:hypothetical protein
MPTLKTLVIDGGSNGDSCLLVISAPTMTYLHPDVFIDHFHGGISISKVPSLAKASISLKGHAYILDAGKLNDDQFELLCSISNAASLELSGVGTTVCLCCFCQYSILFIPISNTVLQYYTLQQPPASPSA